ncbi:DUF928 domain-containing protein [Komarekiella sp. 'clone 1']|uniref:DUF928 domain-containing protein n=1 Tax=Komarekiella delphini-convector SJRDD-AB1 TaxID=2593771 RepID=A0AA40VRS9_9NOST|nr:DUF928 domain-containing protein [Komarekiella delphini-convector]MBD6617222.1 DUF928 domain-containing protein [Komarekiella delphini-convector SJRDD-AB1]
MKLRNFSSFQSLSSKANQRRLVSIFTLSLFLLVIPEANAKFKPRTRKTPSEHSRAGGSRGCPGDGGIPLTLLAPQTYVGETASKRPTFAWFMSTARTVDFMLFEVKPKQLPQIVMKAEELNSSPGVNKFAFPSTQPELTVGKEYFWQISMLCPSGLAFVRAEFQVVNIPLALKGSIKSASNSTQKVTYLAEQGLWYDAFAEALKYSNQGKLGELGSNLIQELIEHENVESKLNVSETINRRIKNLQLISQQEI